MFGIDIGIGSILEKVSDTIGLPEPIGDVFKIGAGLVSGNPLEALDGTMDLQENVADWMQQALDLGPSEPGKPEPFWKTLGRDYLSLLRGEDELYKKGKGAMGKLAGGALAGGSPAAGVLGADGAGDVVSDLIA